MAQKIFAVFWTAALVAALVWSVRVGARNLNTQPSKVMNKSTEELEAELKGLPGVAAAD